MQDTLSRRWRRCATVLLTTTAMLAGLLGASPAAHAAVVSVTVASTTRVSTDASGGQLSGATHTPAASADGGVVAFISDVDLLSADTNGVPDVYVRDLRTTGPAALALVSVNAANTAAGNAASGGEELDISDDGSKVFFRSDATDLVPSDTNATRDLFVRDLTAGVTSRVNVPTASTDNASVVPGPDFFSASADGNKIVFIAYSGLPGGQGVYLRDRAANTTTFVHQALGAQVAISGDGNRVAYSYSNSGYEIYYIILSDPTTAYLINFGTSSNSADPASLLGPNAMSNDGNIVAFWSDGDAYGPLVAKPRAVYAYDHSNRSNFSLAVQRMSELADGTDGNSDSGGTTNDWPKGAVSADGNFVAFTSQASNLDPNAPNGGAMVKNRTTKEIVASSTAELGTDHAARAVSNTTLAAGVRRTVYATAAALVSSDTNGASDVYQSGFTFPSDVTGGPSNVSLTASTASIKPGFTGLESSSVPATALPLDAMSGVAGVPLRSIDLATSPLRSIPLRSIPLRSIPLRSIPLRSITLSELPLANGTWEAILATIPGTPFVGVPLQNISLDQVLDAPGMATVSLGDVDLSATPLRSISVSSILMGATPLRSIPVGGNTATAFTDWCTVLTGLGFSCADLGITQDSTILALDLAGVPLRSIPLRSIPLRSIPLRSIDLAAAPLRSIPLRSIKFGGDLGSMTLDKIKVLNGDATLGASSPGELVDCTDPDYPINATCTAPSYDPPRTLADATTAGALLTGKTFGDLVDHVSPADLTGSLGELIAAMVDTSNYPWETLPLDGLQPFAGAGARQVTYTAHFDVAGGATGGSATVAVDLPPGFLYRAGSTDEHSDGVLDEPVVTGQHLVWTRPLNSTTSYNILFDAYPGFDLASAQTSTIMVTIGGTTVGASNQAPVNVVEDLEGPGVVTTAFLGGGNNSPGTAPIIGGNTMVASHIGLANDVDYYRLPVPSKGTRIQIRLGNHSRDADFDVSMINGTSSTPLRSIPLRSIPLRSIPLTDNGVDATAADSAVSPETLNDIPGVGAAPLRSIGENRGTADELIATVSDADPMAPNESTNYYVLQVTAYNSGHSASPYVLYVKEYAAPPAPACPAPKVYAYPADNAAGTAPSSLPTGLNTLFLVDQKRMGMTYGAAAAQSVIDKLNTLAGQSAMGVTGVVYPVDGDSAADAALNTWDNNPCSPDVANTAFRKVADIVDSVRAQRPTLKNIVVVGGDDMIPMARVADYTQISNESDYAAETLLTTGANKGTPIAAAEATQNILTDDPLADVDPIPWLDHKLYVPDLAVGRMVETPAEITAQIDQFIGSQGKLNPQTSLTTGYDFLADGSQAVDQSLANRITDATKRRTVVSETWSKGDEIAALYPSTGSPDIASLNAHYDHTASLPALGNSTNDLSDLVTTDDIASHPNLTKRLLFTMGCHAGLAMPASYTDTTAKDKDWAQTYSGKQAAVYFANTGFGYGDTASVALSEEVMRQFALRLNGTMSVGEAAIYAKQAYFGQLGAYGPYDEKAMQEATFYGLPMWKIGDGIAPPTASNVTPTTDATGVLSAPVSIAPSFVKKTSKGGGAFYEATAPGTATNGLQVTQYRPIEPRLSVDVTPVGANVAHGVLVTTLASQDEAIVPAMARPVIDLTANEPPPPAGDVSFPTTFQNLTTFNTPQGQRQHVVFMPGQFFRDSSWEGAGGVQRKFTSIGAEVKYSASDDFKAPLLTNVDAVLNTTTGQLTITLTANDETQGNIKKVLVLVKDGSGTWSSHELTSTDGINYAATFAVTGTQIEYFAQAMDAAGNVGVTTNKGRYFSGLPQALSSTGKPSLTLTPGQPTGSNGWYKGNVSVTLSGTPGVNYTKSVDGSAPTAYSASTPVSLSTDGSHSVKALGSDGSRATIVAVIDKTAPTLTATPDRGANANGWYNAPVTVNTSCSDATSGVQVCPPANTFSTNGANQSIGTAFDFAGNARTGPGFNIDRTGPTVVVGGVTDGAVYNGVAPDPTCTVTDALSGPDGCVGSLAATSTPGSYSYVAVGRDKAGNFTTVTVTFRALYLFGGFQQPVNDTAHQTDQAYSVFAGGSTVPLKFQLKKPDGTTSQASSTPTFVTPVRMGPLGGVPVNEPTVTTAPTPGNLFTYDASSKTYSYNWKTDKKTMTGYYWKVGVVIDGQTFTVIIGLK